MLAAAIMIFNVHHCIASCQPFHLFHISFEKEGHDIPNENVAESLIHRH